MGQHRAHLVLGTTCHCRSSWSMEAVRLLTRAARPDSWRSRSARTCMQDLLGQHITGCRAGGAVL